MASMGSRCPWPTAELMALVFNRRTVLGVFVYRLTQCLLVRTYFDPDEYWQCQEVAHRFVYGYGFETWDWQARIRNWLFVLPFIGILQLIKLIGLDRFDFFVVQNLFCVLA